MKNNFLKYVLIFVLLVGFVGCKSSNKKDDKAKTDKVLETKSQTKTFVKDIDAVEFKKIISSDDVIILDVRTSKEVAQGHIEGSSMIDFYSKDFVDKINLVNKEKTICVYCRSGARSSRASKILQKNGFTKVYNLRGGLMSWEANNFPVTKSTIAKDEHIKTMTLEDFKTTLKTEKRVLVEFHTVWCSPCRKMAPIIDELEKEYKGKAVVMRIDVDKSKEVAKAYNIKGVPVFMLFKNGVEKWKHNGIIPKKDLIKQLEK